MSRGPSVRQNTDSRRGDPLSTPTDLEAAAIQYLAGSMNAMLADVFARYLKTKNFRWHMSGPHFRDYHLLLDERADQLFAMTDPMAELRATHEKSLRRRHVGKGFFKSERLVYCRKVISTRRFN